MFAFFLIDFQERLVPHIYENQKIEKAIHFSLEAAHLFNLPLFVSEQTSLGETLGSVKSLFPKEQKIHTKTKFSAVSEKIQERCCLLTGIETHICLFQTAKELLALGKDVIVFKDATGSRVLEDKITSLNELEKLGARITTSETFFYEWIGDSKDPRFKAFLALVKKRSHVL